MSTYKNNIHSPKLGTYFAALHENGTVSVEEMYITSCSDYIKYVRIWFDQR